MRSISRADADQHEDDHRNHHHHDRGRTKLAQDEADHAGLPMTPMNTEGLTYSFSMFQ
jgi:hypothetical protein